MVTCNICGKEFKNTQGLRGHKNFVHSDTGSDIWQPVAQQAAQQLLSSNSGTRAAIEQRLSKLEDRLNKLEGVTEVREPSELEQLLGITDKPITAQLEQHTHQLTELRDQLKNLSQQIKLASNNTEVSIISKQVAQLSEQVKKHDRWLTIDPISLLLSKCSHDCPAFLRDLDRLRKQVNDHQGDMNWAKKKLILVKVGGQRNLA